MIFKAFRESKIPTIQSRMNALCLAKASLQREVYHLGRVKYLDLAKLHAERTAGSQFLSELLADLLR